MRQQLNELLQERVQQCVSSKRTSYSVCEKIERKRESLHCREAEMVKVNAKGVIKEIKKENDDIENVFYQIHFRYFIKQKKRLYLEEEIEKRQAQFYKGMLVYDEELNPFQLNEITMDDSSFMEIDAGEDRTAFRYDRLKAVQYAERWWNDYNPAYKKFDEDCTNYISQCLRAGGAPMRGYPNRGTGWWMQNQNWSYSWTVANSLRWYLPNSKTGLRAKEVSSPDQLLLGDVICYDFEGDGRFNHTTIVTGRDAEGMPLVNAHTFNCRMRYWAYEDSTAYTPNIKYKFLTIMDNKGFKA
ncbi:amidase domain-containing protein [Niallia endozanthoxylica]|uniref:Amidase domain-containing protein n=1 Tax=Niallia endozanthoxylica TaxID=2036016 RepID=A0A5J5I7B9_9BACI|nr:amidase domain-containing protein [Niallia endozanthoxylica]KAA9031596.1 amidase domain-containing protein [Niallia endozanthoxylica]